MIMGTTNQSTFSPIKRISCVKDKKHTIYCCALLLIAEIQKQIMIEKRGKYRHSVLFAEFLQLSKIFYLCFLVHLPKIHSNELLVRCAMCDDRSWNFWSRHMTSQVIWPWQTFCQGRSHDGHVTVTMTVTWRWHISSTKIGHNKRVMITFELLPACGFLCDNFCECYCDPCLQRIFNNEM